MRAIGRCINPALTQPAAALPLFRITKVFEPNRRGFAKQAMPVWNYLTYMSGYMPGDDVAAQRRCIAYLNQAVELAMERAEDTSQGDSTSRQIARSQGLTLSSLEGLLTQWAPSYRWKPAQSFWKYWDRNKRQIIAAHENSQSESDYMRAVGELEDGRYYND